MVNSGQFKQQYDFDENYLNKIDSENKAYFLGFFYADGCNSTDGEMSLELQAKDKSILETFQSHFRSNRPLGFRNRKGKNPNHQDMYSFRLRSKNVSDRLTELGCPPNKTYCLQFPTENQIPSYLLKHFIRGYMDGDGTISYLPRTNRNSYSLTIAFFSYVDFLKRLKEFLRDKFDIKCRLESQHRLNKTNAGFRLVLRHKYESIPFIHWLYNGSNIHLYRKYDKYKEVVNNEKENLKAKSIILSQ